MASGVDDRLHGLWTRPGQTLRGRVNHRAREPPKSIPKTSSQRIAESCENGNIIVIIMKLWNVASPLQRSKKQIYGKSHRRFALCCANTCKDAGFSSR